MTLPLDNQKYQYLPALSSHIICKMADDTRDQSQPQPRGPPPGQYEAPDHIKAGSPKVYEVFNAPPVSANALPEGMGQNTAGGREKVLSLGDAVKTVRIQDFAQVHMYPCVRESLLTAFGGGFAVGGIRALLGGEIAQCSAYSPTDPHP